MSPISKRSLRHHINTICGVTGFAACVVAAGALWMSSFESNTGSQTSVQLVSSKVIFENDTTNAQRGVGETFTYQGVLADSSGQSVTGPVGINIQYLAVRNAQEIVVSSTDFSSLTLASNGSFMVEIPLPNAAAMSSYTSQYLRVTELSSGDVIAEHIPITPSPRAWHAEYANHAKVADNAEESEYSTYAEDASNATFAIRAQTMLDESTVDLTLQLPFRNWQGTEYGPARARKTNKTVFLSGYVQTNGPIDLGVVITTLPEGFRPEYLEVFWVYTDSPNSGNRRVVQVYPNGEVIINTNVYPGSISLSGIVFQAAP